MTSYEQEKMNQKLLSKESLVKIKDKNKELYKEITIESLTRNKGAHCERIASIPRATTANGTVIYNMANCILSAGARARVRAFLIDACFVVRTFGTNDTLWSAARWTSNVQRFARADSLPIDFTTHTVWTTWRWVTRIYGCCLDS